MSRDHDHNQKPLKEVIDKFLKVYKLDRKYKQVEVAKAWSAVLGKYINDRTKHIYLNGTVLRVKLESSVIAEEIKYSKSKVIDDLNAHIGRRLVEEIVFSD